jgi:hypothetical protein
MPPTGQRQTMLFSATFPKEIQRLAAGKAWAGRVSCVAGRQAGRRSGRELLLAPGEQAGALLVLRQAGGQAAGTAAVYVQGSTGLSSCMPAPGLVDCLLQNQSSRGCSGPLSLSLSRAG